MNQPSARQQSVTELFRQKKQGAQAFQVDARKLQRLNK